MGNTRKFYGGKTKKIYGGKTKKIYGGKTKKIYGGKLRRWFTDNIGPFFCPYPLVRHEGRCITKSSRNRKRGQNPFPNVGTSIDPYKFTPKISIANKT